MNIVRMRIDQRWYAQINTFIIHFSPRHRPYMPNSFYSIEHLVRGQALGPDNDAPEA